MTLSSPHKVLFAGLSGHAGKIYPANNQDGNQDCDMGDVTVH